jgi:cytosine/adenosine deaminase-related metal-dependent hydrolase
MTDIVLKNATVITMDPARRVLDNTSVAVRGGRIAAIGTVEDIARDHPDAKTIDCRRKVVMPGMVDLHGYIGGSLMRSVGEHLDGARRREMSDFINTRATDEDWWRVEARMDAMERLKLGTTTMFSMMGGNGTRTDDANFVRIVADEIEGVGLRTRIGIGPARPPWPRLYSTWKDGVRTDRHVKYEEVIANCEELFNEQAKSPRRLVDYWVALSRVGNRNEHDPVWSADREQWVTRQAESVRHLMDTYKVGFWTHMYGNAVEYAHDHNLNLLGPNTILSHCTDLSQRSIDIMRETGTSAGHHPRVSRIYAYPGRCPVPEMIDAGVTVALGSDMPSNHDCDIFLDMKMAIWLQRVEFKNPRLIPAGKALEMATIDGYKALGLDHELGSVEVGKKADLITIDMAQPHLHPIDTVVHMIVYNANGHDVRDVLVDGQLVMENRKMLTVDEGDVLDSAYTAYRRVLERAGVEVFTETPKNFWGVSR